LNHPIRQVLRAPSEYAEELAPDRIF